MQKEQRYRVVLPELEQCWLATMRSVQRETLNTRIASVSLYRTLDRPLLWPAEMLAESGDQYWRRHTGTITWRETPEEQAARLRKPERVILPIDGLVAN